MAEQVGGAPRWLLPALAMSAIAGLACVLVLGPDLANEAAAFSSTRTDPQGTSALFNAYAAAGLQTVRSYDVRTLDDLSPAATTAFVLEPQAWPEGLAARLLAFAGAGGTVVLAGLPLPVPGLPSASPTGTQPAPSTLAQLLGIRMRLVRQDEHQADATTKWSPVFSGGSMHRMPLVHPEYGLHLPQGWTPLFVRGGVVYAAERSIGHGRIIAASEATFLSNDNLRQEPDIELLSWLVTGRTEVWVDETTHGLSDDPGTAWLLQRYHLRTGVLLLLAGFALLGWAIAAGLEQPPDPGAEASDQEFVPLPASAGLVRLLQRALPPGELLAEVRRRVERDEPALAAHLRLSPPSADEDPILAYYREAVCMRKDRA